MPTDDFEQLFRAGVAAAKAGNRVEARDLLGRALRADPRSVPAWLWLSGVMSLPQEREKCLQQVLKLDPQNEAALKGLASVNVQVIQALLQEGIAAAEAGQREQARERLMQVVEREDENVTAWLWLSRVVDTDEDRQVCFENVLTLDPDNREAQEGLAALRPAEDSDIFNPWSIAPEEAAQQRAYASPAGEVLGEAYVRQQTPEQAADFWDIPDPPSLALWERFDNEYLCPYCAAETAPEDTRCSACNHSLQVKLRRREERSLFLWILIVVQALSAIFGLALPFIILFAVGSLLGLEDPVEQLSSIYLGGAATVPSATSELVLTLLPRGLFFLLWLPAVIYGIEAVVLYIRWPPIFYLMLVSAVLQVIGSIIGLARGSFLEGIIGIVLSLIQLFLIFQLEDDFITDKARLLLQLDPNAKTTIAFMTRGRMCASSGLWALAAIHYRRAAAITSNQIGPNLALTVACIKLREYELAGYALAQAREIDPKNAKIEELAQVLEQERQGQTALAAGV